MFLGLKLQKIEWAATLSNIALVLGAAITVLSAYEAFFDPRSLWVRETVTFVRLKDLQRDLLFWKSGKDIEDIDIKELDKLNPNLIKFLRIH